MHYYQKHNGVIVASCKSEQPGFEYSEDEIVKDYAGRLVFKKETETVEYILAKLEHEQEQYKEELRMRREKECFYFTDRAAWFYGLTDVQKAEVLEWREAWLNVTETLVVPKRPAWI